jgi:hypothetical protein
VLTVQELTPRYAAALELAGIRRALPEAVRTVRPTVRAVRRKVSGGGIYSRLPLRELAGPGGNVSFRMPRVAVGLGDGHRAGVVDVHPYPPRRNLVDLWRRQLATLPAATPAGPPWVLAGDFNATLDFDELRDLLDTGYRDAGEVTGEGLAPTWPAGQLFPPPVTIDHVLADRRVAILDYSVEDLPGSDHHAVFARLAVP